ncbi:MAG: cupin domain-containing protein [Alphaproteobacteria bacterium]|nr:MAG: cupin domain-containing protein [Alphaproteobacteria bacterium]
MPVISGFGALEKLPWERINDKIERRVLAGKHGMIVWWKIKAGAHAGAHQHPHEQIVWMLKGKMDFRLGNERRSMVAGDVSRRGHAGLYARAVIRLPRPPAPAARRLECARERTIPSKRTLPVANSRC